ncbi:Os10g0519550 [Oryza sativa Japonica Group]|uniref:Os10g0519550 protein n=1 Tax=Oryza sativa subsp. japonica TaxID=39947 RepID=A0A0P0XWT8_ORYSJ|nr:Os10g0519550 [Oryza sativa Japonica Group]
MVYFRWSECEGPLAHLLSADFSSKTEQALHLELHLDKPERISIQMPSPILASDKSKGYQLRQNDDVIGRQQGSGKSTHIV